MNALEVKDLRKEYRGFTLDSVSFCVPENHIAGLVGRNGAGKSTTIKAIMRLISASGSVRVCGLDMSENERAAKNNIGYVGGGFGFYPLAALGKIADATSMFYDVWDNDVFDSYCKEFSLDKQKRVRDLSQGMKVKFALALALSHKAKLLILDEPTSGLDPVSRDEFCEIALSLVKSESVSILFSTHITSDLAHIADDIVYISSGRILAAEPLDSFAERYTEKLQPTAGKYGVTLDDIIVYLEKSRRGGEL